MRPPGAFKIAHRARAVQNYTDPNAVRPTEFAGGCVEDELPDFDTRLGPLLASDARSQRILESLRNEIVEAGGGPNLRIRLVFREPREIFRLELELPSLGYQRTTLLDREALEQLLEVDEVREVVQTAELGL